MVFVNSFPICENLFCPFRNVNSYFKHAMEFLGGHSPYLTTYIHKVFEKNNIYDPGKKVAQTS